MTAPGQDVEHKRSHQSSKYRTSPLTLGSMDQKTLVGTLETTDTIKPYICYDFSYIYLLVKFNL